MPNLCHCAPQAPHCKRPRPNPPAALREPNTSPWDTTLPERDRRLRKAAGGLGAGLGRSRFYIHCTGLSPQLPHTHLIPHTPPGASWRWLQEPYHTLITTQRTIRDRFCTHVVRARNINSDSKKKKKKYGKRPGLSCGSMVNVCFSTIDKCVVLINS
jgi:hypothetical protein